MIKAPKQYPRKILPESPIKTLAEGQLKNKNPRQLVRSNGKSNNSIDELLEIISVEINVVKIKIAPVIAKPSIPSIKL